MNYETKHALATMRRPPIGFLDMTGTIEEDEWRLVLRAVKANKEKVVRLQTVAGVGDLFMLMVYVQEILEKVIAENV